MASRGDQEWKGQTAKPDINTEDLPHVVLDAPDPIVWSRHAEHRVVVPLTQSESASTVVVTVSQIFITLLTVSLVLTTQQLALWGTLLRRQTLTASHDETAAWTGLGSALLSLWRQTYIAASVMGTLSIALYLAGIAILHVSTPSLFGLQPFNNTGNGLVSTTIGMPNFTLDEQGDPFGTAAPFSKIWTDADALLPYLQRVSPKNTIGVSNATLYDIPDDNSGLGDMSVGATAFNVTCGTINNATAVNANASDPAGTWTITATYDGYTFSFPAHHTVPYEIRQVSPLTVSQPSTQILARNVFFYSAANLTDSKGSLGSVVELQPAMNMINGEHTENDHINETNANTLYSLQLLGCTLSHYEQQAVVEASTKGLVSVSPSAVKTASEWKSWHPELQSKSNHWTWIQDPSVDAWGELFFYMPPGTYTASGACPTADNCMKLTLAEELRISYFSIYLMQRLGIYPQTENTIYNLGATPLHAFENALASMTASLYWAAANIGSDQFVPPNYNQTAGNHVTLLRGEARASITEARLNINITPLAVGLATSVVLLALAIRLVRVPAGYNAAISAVGVLQLLWLVNGRPALREQVSQVDEPTIENLRAAGMFEVRVASDVKGDNGYYKLAQLESSDIRARHDRWVTSLLGHLPTYADSAGLEGLGSRRASTMASHSDEGTTNCQQETTKLDIKALEDLPHVVLEESNPADLHHGEFSQSIRFVVPHADLYQLFTVSLVLTTQQLALRGTLLRRQTLTASHDETTAWTGLGSALVTLWRQTYLAASVLGTLSIALYLAGIAVLHVSTPSLFALQPFNNTDNGVISTTVGMPSFFLNESADPSGSQAPFTKMWTDTNALLPYLQRVNPKNTIGVSNATLYDVPDDNSGVNNITVGATALNVTCGMISNATAVNTNSSDPTSTWTIVASYDGYNFSFPAALTGAIVHLRPLAVCDQTEIVSCRVRAVDADFVSNCYRFKARNVFFYSSANLTDSKGNLGSVVELQPPMVNQINDTTSRTLYSLQLLGCTLSLVEQQAIVDAQRKSLVAASPSATKTASEWTNWHPELQSSSNHWAWIQDPSVDAWGDLFFYMPEGTVDASGTCTGPDDCDKLTLSEEFSQFVLCLSLLACLLYIMQRLGLYPEDTNSVFNIGTTTLHDFENTLATMSASLYWAAANIESDQFAPPGFNNSLGGHAELLRGEARISTTEARLNLAVGLGTSAVLLALAVLLVRAPDGYDAAINTVGVLQLLWLVNGRPSLREQVSQVDEPTIDNLRAAGMFEVRVASEMKGDDGSYKLVRLESSDDRARYGL
ncbi:hypothetical protein PLICRDRAFT_32355 [Plicaturopsis crispa FD-325 SS-3]|uniref:Uncharacterized protein n=1 Tax=Plicaturopsis crispa FD-325 SS-3 TaxID=944288 RepID=A0A0C9SR32_PLICR|nr:hypothetical protein PLICRDRAFT_32355 [Plicaturopsis crispa FD-325 SS-3]